MKLNRFQKFVARVCKITPLDIEKALRDALHKGIEITEKKYAEQAQMRRSVVWICELCKQQALEKIGCYELPDKNTDKPTIPPALRDPKYLEQIRTQHNLPRLPNSPHKLHFTRIDGPPLDATQVRIPTWLL